MSALLNVRILRVDFITLSLCHIGWSPWTNYTMCSKTCGGGKMKRTRECLADDGMCSGVKVTAPEEDVKDCSATRCPGEMWCW